MISTPQSVPPGTPPILSVQKLSKHFVSRGPGVFRKSSNVTRAVDEVSFDLQPGEALGLVGESGSGKTTLARCILRAIHPTAGKALFRPPGGNIVDLAALPDAALPPLRPHLQMIFQDPFASLNPRMTIGQIVGEPLVIHRLARGSELEDRVARVLSRVGLKPEHRTRYPHAFSGGQRQRIGIARALIMQPSLIVADEAVSALDISVQAQVLNLLKDLQEEFNLTCLFVAHNLDVVRHFCDRIAVMYAGRIVELAPTGGLFQRPLHPYTRALLDAVPRPDPDARMKFDWSGEIADPGNLPAGCAFCPRCPLAFANCHKGRPALAEISPGHFAACHAAESAHS